MLRKLYDATHGAEKVAVVLWALLMLSGLDELSTEGPTTLYIALSVGLFVWGHTAITVYRYNRLPVAEATPENDEDDDPTVPLPVIPEDSFGIVPAVPFVRQMNKDLDVISVLYRGHSFTWFRPHGVVHAGVPVDFIVDPATSDIDLLALSEV